MNDQVLVKIVDTNTDLMVDNRVIHESRVDSFVEGFNVACEILGSPLRAIVTCAMTIRAEFGLAKAA